MNGPVVPFRQFVLKVHSRCDLACDHCYIYEHQDQSWRGRPMAMSPETVAWIAARIAEHAKAHQLDEARVILHGGEPLLAGPARLQQAARALREALSGVCELDLRIHTNGILLDDAFCDLFAAEQIKVGVSVDGYQAAHDRHRRYADGRGSYEQVVRAIERLRSAPYRHLYAGLLCTIDIANDPVAVYDSLLALGPPRIDFLLPHATWDNPPPHPPGQPALLGLPGPAGPSGSTGAYADWLLKIFGRWNATGRPVPVRLFDSIITTTLGGASLTEAMGLEPSDLVVIETDGTYEQADSLKTAFDGAPVTGLDVIHDDLDTVARHPAIADRQHGLAGLCATCRACPVVASCGGGLYAHRYRSGSGFANPSVYCADLMKLITNVRQAIWPAAGGQPGAVTTDDRRQPAIGDAELAELAAGYGGAAALGSLMRAQRGLRRALLAAVHEAAQAGTGSGAEAAGAPAAWDLLTRIDTDNPQAVDAVLGHPYVRVWAVQCLEGLRAGQAGASTGTLPPAAGLGHLAAIAIAAAIRAGAPARLPVPVRDGFVNLPSLGRFAAGEAGPDAMAMVEAGPADEGTFTVAGDDGRWTVRDATSWPGPAAGENSGSARWQPVRRLPAPGLSVALEDTDPFRDCHHWPAMPRLDNDEAARWQCQFGKAWDLIRAQHSGYAPGLAAGLSTIMPLAGAGGGRDTSATARHAFGAVGAALPADHATLALLLIHEFQHVKLGAVLDMTDLFDRADQRLYRVAWRDDARPLEAVLQGTYAHIAVTDFWRVRRHTADGPAAQAAAETHFAHWRAGTADAIETLAGSGALTPLGKMFVDGMRRSITPWLDEPVRAGAGGGA